MLTTARAASTLDEEFEMVSEEASLVEIPVLSTSSAASTLEDDDEIESELVLIAVSAASTLDDEPLTLTLEV